MVLRSPKLESRLNPERVNQAEPAVRGTTAAAVLLSRGTLQKVLGGLWLLDGLLQLQPSMFTSTLVTGIMEPASQGQPGVVSAMLQPVLGVAAHHVVAVNLAIAVVQLTLGLALLSGHAVRPALLASVGWSLAVWLGGEGLGMLLTGQASVLTGAPGAVLLYAVLGLAAYPVDDAAESARPSPTVLRWVLIGFWLLAAALQVQSYWWQPGQISSAIAAMEGQGTLSGSLFGPTLARLARATTGREAVINAAVILVALAIAAGLAMSTRRQRRVFLLASILASAALWGVTEGFGQLLTGSATDVNSGPLLILLAVACWPSDIREPASTGREATVQDRARVRIVS